MYLLYEWAWCNSLPAQLLRFFQPKFSRFLHSTFELCVWIAFHFVLFLVVFATRIRFLLCQLSLPLVSLSWQFFLMRMLTPLVVHPVKEPVTRVWFSGVVLEMCRGVPANSGAYGTVKEHAYTSCPSGKPALTAESGSWAMSLEGGSNGKCGMFWFVLRTRFNFPWCNNFTN